MALEDEIIRLLVEIDTFIAYIIQKVYDYLADIAFRVASALQAMVQTVLNALTPLLTKIADFLQGIVTQFATYFQAILDKVTQAFVDTWNKIVEVSVIVFDKITAFVEAAWSNLKAFAEGLIAQVTGFLEAAVKGITDLIQGAINSVALIFDTARIAVQNAVAAFLAIVEATFNGVVARVEASYRQLITGAESIIASVERRLSDLRSAVKEATDKLLEQLAGVAEEDLGPIRDAVKAFVKEFLILADPVDQAQVLQSMRGITSGDFTMDQFRQFVQSGWEHLVPKSPLWQALFIGLLFILNTVPVIIHLSEASSRIVTQQFDYNFPTELLSTADAVRGWRKGLLSETEAIDTIRRQGINSTDATRLLQMSEEEPGLSDLLSLWHRGLATESDVDAALFERGFNEQWRAALKAGSRRLPSISDLLSLADAQVFDDSISTKYGLEAEYPEELTALAAQQGLPAEWVRKFWAAHWSEPGASSLFDMFQRGVISEEELSEGLRAAGIPPFWRSRLLATSYTPLSRIDLRRMHKLGLLDANGVLQGYKTLGYSPKDAAALTDFTVKLNKPTTPEEATTIATLSRTNVLGFYADGILTKKQTQEILISLGYAPETAALFIESEDLASQRIERKAETDLVISQAVAGAITFQEAQTKLDSLGLETLEKEKAITQLLRAEQTKSKLPTREEAERMVLAGIIAITDYRDLLSRLGYAPRWQEAFAKLLLAKAAAELAG